MNKALLFGGFVLLAIAATIAPQAITNFKLLNSKKIVIVTLLDLPNCNNGSYRNKFLTLEYKGSKTVLRTSCKYINNFHIGQQVEMFHEEGTNNFIFPKQDVYFELISDFLIGLISIIIIIIAIRKSK